MTDRFKGYMLGAVAAATYGMNPLFALPLYDDGMNTDSVLLFRYLLAIPIIAVMILIRGRSFAVERRHAAPLAVMGMLMAFSSLALFMSYRHMDAGIASTLLFVYPIMVALLMALLFRERLPLATVLCITAALGGISLLYKGSDGAVLSTAGTLWVVSSALAYAIYIVGVNRSGLKDVATLTVTFHVLSWGVLLFVVRLCMTGGLTLPDKWYLWANLVSLAVFPTAISLICTTSAIQYIGSTPTAILGALEPVTAVLIGVTVFGERLTVSEIAGLVLIIGAVTMVVGGSRITHNLLHARKLFPRIRKHRR